MSFTILKKTIIDKGLCVGCGTCIGICPDGVLDSSESGGVILKGNCSGCGLCVESCPGGTVDFSLIGNRLFGQGISGKLGYIRNGYIACSHRDEAVRLSGSSGGVITSLLLYLLESGAIDGVVVSDFSETEPWQPNAVLARSSEEIVKASGSKYMVYPHNKILRTLKTLETESIAYVGLPCHIHALRKIETIAPEIVAPIKLCIGLYCGLNLTCEVVGGLMERFGIEDRKEISDIRYRNGQWPGKVVVSLRDGRRCEMDKLCFNYFNFLYTPKRCLMCIDLSSEFSDISVGDGWLKEQDHAIPGWSVVLARSERGQEVIEAAIDNDIIQCERISEEQLHQMHAHNLNNKKIGAYIRMNRAAQKGKSVPVYNAEFPDLSIKRVWLERANALLLWLGNTGPIKKLMHRIPLGIMNWFMVKLRSYLKCVSNR
jgi:coenzyme F420 hydrogenase subunit beta